MVVTGPSLAPGLTRHLRVVPMSAGVEDSDKLDGDASTTTLRSDHHHHHVLIETQEDRWRWRRKIRQNPHQLRVYRVAVAIAGLFFIALGFVSGPLPGPGGIPLVLLGLAIWASEFEWAHQLMLVFKAQLVRFRSWSRPRQALFWLAFFACCGLLGYTYVLVLGVPGWMPDPVHRLLDHLPGV